MKPPFLFFTELDGVLMMLSGIFAGFNTGSGCLQTGLNAAFANACSFTFSLLISHALLCVFHRFALMAQELTYELVGHFSESADYAVLDLFIAANDAFFDLFVAADDSFGDFFICLYKL